MELQQFLRRSEAGEYIRKRYGFCSEKMLGKLATCGGGPIFIKRVAPSSTAPTILIVGPAAKLALR